MATERKNTEARIHPSKDVAREMSWQDGCREGRDEMRRKAWVECGGIGGEEMHSREEVVSGGWCQS